MANRTGKVIDCVFESEWINPLSKKTVYYHKISIDNGDVGRVGALEQNSSRIKVGALIEYDMDENNKIKVHQSSNDAKKFAKNQVLKDGVVVLKGATQKGRRHDEFLGFVWGWAKDLVIAGKTMDDVRKMPEMAHFLYEEIGKVLSQQQQQVEIPVQEPEPIKKAPAKSSKKTTTTSTKKPTKSRAKKFKDPEEFKFLRQKTEEIEKQKIVPISQLFMDDEGNIK
jgi:hypothetical protein